MSNKITNPKGFILITSIVLMFVCSSIIFVYFKQIFYEDQRVEFNIERAKAKYNAHSGFACEAYEHMFYINFLDTTDTGGIVDSIQTYLTSDECIARINIAPTWGGDSMGLYDDVSVRLRTKPNGQMLRYGFAKGTARYEDKLRKKYINFTDSIDITTSFVPSLNTFMYLTANEAAGGAPQTMDDGDRSTVTFGGGDSFGGGANGEFQSNGILMMSAYSCPSFDQTVTVTQNCDGTVNDPVLPAGCDPFNGDPELDTTSAVCLPPPSFEEKKQFADYTFDATELLVSSGLSYPGGLQRDTLIMTELEFLDSGGFRVSRYKYLMPPHLNSIYAGELSPNINGSHLEWRGFENLFGNESPCPASREIHECFQYERALNRYHAKTIGPDPPLGNAPNSDTYIDSDVREAHGVHHFDTHISEYDPGRNCAFEPASTSGNSNSTELRTEYYFPTKPTAIYIKGGPVLVHGRFRGRFTVITDDIMTYRRHAFHINNATDTPLDTIYCNIWLVDDLINDDATYVSTGSNTGMWTLDGVQPDDECRGGSQNSIGLVSGANIIIANTRNNGARGGMATSGNDHINIHAHMIAFNESFTIQFWQNSLANYWNDWQCNDPDNDGICNGVDTYKGDGNGQRYGNLTGTNDKRGMAFVWGGMVQLFRGYMLRNYQGPYNDTPGVGMDKNYNWDDNQRCNVLPLYPEAENCNEECGINKVPAQYNFNIEEFRIF